MIDLDALEAKARAAVQEPWFVNPEEPCIVSFAEGDICDTLASTCSPDEDAPNASHIAAFDPPTALALIARIREMEAERAIVKRFMQMVWRWCNRPNVTDAERISFIRNHPTLEMFVEPPDDAYRAGVPEAARIGKEAAGG